MGYWGWRPMVLCVFFCVWVVGCTGTWHNARPEPPTESPPVTLQIRERRTLTPTTTPGLPVVATRRVTPTFTTSLTPHAPAMAITTPTPLPVGVRPPTCYGQRSGGVLCLGEVTNPADIALARVVVRVTILDRAGNALRVQDVTLPQRAIPPGEAAAYSALFVPDSAESLVNQFGGVSVRVLRAEIATAPSFTNLTAIDTASTVRGGRVVVTGTVVNNGEVPAREIRLIVTIYDAADRVTGFRVVEADDLPPGEALAFTVEVPAQNRVEPYRYRIQIEARRGESR